MSEENQYEAWLRTFLASQGGVAGTVHLSRNGELHLAAAVNIPPPVVEAVRRVPSGKGMAGLALERKEPIQTCNLKDDQSGNVRPGAKAVNAQAAVALPVANAEGAIVSVVGIAFSHEREFNSAELNELAAATSSIQSIV
jgi:hypothetical protein